jgi:hypothetical protein
MSPVKYELGFYMTEDEILHSHRRENLRYYMDLFPSSSEGRETPTLLVPLERTNLNHLTFNEVLVQARGCKTVYRAWRSNHHWEELHTRQYRTGAAEFEYSVYLAETTGLT